MKYLLLFAVTLSLVGCECLDSVKIKPEANNINIPTGTVGTIGVETDWKFKECCIQGEQKKIALGIQHQIAEDFTKVTKGELSVADYNAHVKAANDALNNVVLVCKASKDPSVLQSPAFRRSARTLSAPRAPQQMNLQQLENAAWAHANAVLQQLQTGKLKGKRG